MDIRVKMLHDKVKCCSAVTKSTIGSKNKNAEKNMEVSEKNVYVFGKNVVVLVQNVGVGGKVPQNFSLAIPLQCCDKCTSGGKKQVPRKIW